jgi:mRNA-degrading endonuclease RelE of RelBE toxin-antitoxin system
MIAKDPYDLHLSYPLTATDKRSTRVGKFRVLFQVDSETLTVSDVGPRGQIYRKL